MAARKGVRLKQNPPPELVKRYRHTVKFTQAENDLLEKAYPAAKMERMAYMRMAILKQVMEDLQGKEAGLRRMPAIETTEALTLEEKAYELSEAGVVPGDIAHRLNVSLKKVLKMLGKE